MKKDFLTISPDSGGGTAEISVQADVNPKAQSRETTVNIDAMGRTMNSIKAVQQGLPFLFSLGVSGVFQPTKAELSGSILYPSSVDITEDGIPEFNYQLSFGGSNGVNTQFGINLIGIYTKQFFGFRIFSAVIESSVSASFKMQQRVDLGEYFQTILAMNPITINSSNVSSFKATIGVKCQGITEHLVRFKINGGYS